MMAYEDQIMQDQLDFEEGARRIVNEAKDYKNFRPYMVDECGHVARCNSCMCPFDERLNAREFQDAMLACTLEGAQQAQGRQ